jgi:phenylacetate-CoA ligase
MSLLNTVYRSIILPRYAPQRYSGLNARWRHFEKLESQSLSANQELQWTLVQQVLLHAYETTDFYRKRFAEAGLTPKAIQSSADLAKLPLLTRDDLRQNLHDLKSKKFAEESLETSQTGGTTDTPVALLRSPDSIRARMAAQLRFNAWANALPGDRSFWLWGAQQDFSHTPSLKWRMFEQYFLRKCWAFSARLNEQVLAEHLQLLNRFRPKVIVAYPTPLTVFCEYLERNGQPFHRPEVALVTAEPLLDDQRATIQRVMGIDPFVQYGTRDFGMAAAECEQHRGLHVNPTSVFIEYLPVPGNVGLHEMVITDLTNLAMPMIRYKINDCASPLAAACPCGRGYPVMSNVVGRTTDNFYLADGTVIPGVTLPGRILKVCPGIAKMQVVQETFSEFTVRYVAGESFQQSDLAEVAANFKRYVGDVHIRFEPVAEIPREPSGKTRFFLSRLARAQSTGGRTE